MLGGLGAALIVLAVTHVVTVICLACRPHAGPAFAVLTTVCGAGAGCALDAWLVPGYVAAAMGAAEVVVVAAGGYGFLSRWLHPAGAAAWSSWLLLGAALLGWGVLFLAHLDVSRMTSALLWATSALSAVTLPSAVVQTREGWEPLLVRRRRRVGRPPVARAGWYAPRVSVHVPCHAEPPHIVIGTLDCLARLDYPDFEVLVIDNNTADPELWLPVKAHCERLGPRFRFLHVEGITGAKAGALNWALGYTCPRAELIAVVDADYQVRRQWLRNTAGYFADPGIGFVQCPHAYRGYAQSTLGRWANWEYAVFFATGMVSLDEHRAGITVGTMSLIRRAALERAGGWAEWCLTEDSELAIRIHAIGYQSIYLTEPYGRGLIPETFEGYRRQRYRWTFGPVQEFQRHWRLYLPGPLGTPSALTAPQKLHHGNHGLDVMSIGLRALCFPLAAAAAASMVAHHERVPMPAELWIAATCLLAGNLLLRWLVYRRVVRATARQALGGMLAFAALTHVITLASLRALVRRPARWQRTDKFRSRQRGIRALTCARSETVLGLAGLLAAAALTAVNRSGGVATALAIGLAVQAVTYLTAPMVALAADRSLARAFGNLLDIPAVAHAAGLHRPPNAVPGHAHTAHTPGHRGGWAIPRPASGGSHPYHPHVTTGACSGRTLSQNGTASRPLDYGIWPGTPQSSAPPPVSTAYLARSAATPTTRRTG
jgi:Glycosyltransferase like family 2